MLEIIFQFFLSTGEYSFFLKRLKNFTSANKYENNTEEDFLKIYLFYQNMCPQIS